MGLVPDKDSKESLGEAAFWWAAGFGISKVLKKFIALPLLAFAAVGLALAWSGVEPVVSDFQARRSSNLEADAKVVSQRLVCDATAARQFVVLDTSEMSRGRMYTGRHACDLREEALLRFADAKGTTHEVVATNRYGTFGFEQDPRLLPNLFGRIVPLVDPSIAFEGDALSTLQAVSLIEPDNTPAPSPVAMIQADARDTLLVEAHAWMRPPPGAAVRLRYSERDPGHAWIAGLIGEETPSRMPPFFAIAPLGAAAWILFFVLPAWLGFLGRRGIAIATVAIALSTPLWADRLFDVMDRLGIENGAILSAKRGAPWLFDDAGRRVAPRTERASQALPDGDAFATRYRGIVDGLVPPHPARAAASLGQAYEALCAGLSERALALPAEERERRFAEAKSLLDDSKGGPAGCLVQAALADMDAAEAKGEPAPTYAYVLLADLLLSGFEGQVPAASAESARKLRETVQRAKDRADERSRNR